MNVAFVGDSGTGKRSAASDQRKGLYHMLFCREERCHPILSLPQPAVRCRYPRKISVCSCFAEKALLPCVGGKAIDASVEKGGGMQTTIGVLVRG